MRKLKKWFADKKSKHHVIHLRCLGGYGGMVGSQSGRRADSKWINKWGLGEEGVSPCRDGQVCLHTVTVGYYVIAVAVHGGGM